MDISDIEMRKKKYKFDYSVFFFDCDNNRRFLFRVINYGKEADELKFIFIPTGLGLGFTYFENLDTFTESDLVGQYAEVTYHKDGTLLHKFQSDKRGGESRYKNPAGTGRRRTPISQLREWEPFVRYTIVDCSSLKVIKSDRAFSIPHDSTIFNGDPFICTLFLGHKIYACPPNNSPTEMIYRINDVARNVDLILWFYKSDYQGRLMQVGKSDLTIHLRANIIEVVEKRQ